jgi:hypothetical protein
MTCPSEKLSKNCKTCGKIFYKTPSTSKKNWLFRSLYCSRECAKHHNLGRVGPNLGKKFSEEHRENLSIAHIGQTAWNKGIHYEQVANEKNYLWKGDDATMTAKHQWVYRRVGKANHCDECGLNDPTRKYQWSNISRAYKRDITDYRQLCIPCHKKYDLAQIALHKKQTNI